MISNNINLAPGGVLQILLRFHQQERVRGKSIHKNIDIAVLALFIAGY